MCFLPLYISPKKTQCEKHRFGIQDCGGRMLLLENAFGRHQMIDRRLRGSLDLLFLHHRSCVMACSFVPLVNVRCMLVVLLCSVLVCIRVSSACLPVNVCVRSD